MKWPEASEGAQSMGWCIDFKFLESVREGTTSARDVSLGAIEEILLVAASKLQEDPQ